ncbi:MAG: hypothetical protein F6J98_19960 [Moorea sp. SIO4G2]|uniref:hypothetical protein n=1 Tax=Moorena sp. SIO3E8 TaxID=2607830 RepID=UPI0013F846D7|nr:hypothetical protein [Moorena sp. SIO3E8]NEO10898.1 hypothetical protein [Moorena sp. SIO3E8]NEO46661.1 hypothetical protein [Moorena sp. SIO4A3]NEO62585.1 hypothetical protein [Moorena sp. SIO4G2]
MANLIINGSRAPNSYEKRCITIAIRVGIVIILVLYSLFPIPYSLFPIPCFLCHKPYFDVL